MHSYVYSILYFLPSNSSELYKVNIASLGNLILFTSPLYFN